MLQRVKVLRELCLRSALKLQEADLSVRSAERKTLPPEAVSQWRPLHINNNEVRRARREQMEMMRLRHGQTEEMRSRHEQA